mmetsp:Transcript_21542/g.69449  ORF Transcript_21542/g.69449 Transcript_21542/m.69449 type:complete len:205 (+) Transcript_21542:2-616(+)
MLTELDALVGVLLSALRSGNELNQTIIVFTSDNGGLPCKPGSAKALANGAWTAGPGSSSAAPACTDSSGGLRGFKGSIFEGGHRVPLLLSWPAGGVGAGAASSDLVGLVDLYATLLDLVGAPPPAIGQAVDSVSFKQRLLAPRARGASSRCLKLTLSTACPIAGGGAPTRSSSVAYRSTSPTRSEEAAPAPTPPAGQDSSKGTR